MIPPYSKDNHQLPSVGELLVVTPLAAHRSVAGTLVLTEKFLSGMQAYALRWPGKVSALVRLSNEPDDNPGHQEVRNDETSYSVELAPEDPATLQERCRLAAIVLGGPIGLVGVPQVMVTINTLRTICQIISTDAPDPLRRFKRTLRAVVEEFRLRRAIRLLAGLQSNGTPTYNSYKHLNTRTMQFFDSRMGADDLVSLDCLNRRLNDMTGGRRLRLLFSGRMVRIKGVLDLPDVAAELRQLGVDFEMHICGGGPCAESLQRRIKSLGLSDCVLLRGELNYRSQLLPLVRNATDLFVCPHLQGDPSHTYLETMGCGVPIVGYANEAWSGLAPLSNAGWTTPMGKPRQLAAKIAELCQDRQQLVDAAQSARAFASRNLFEETMDRRVEHLLLCLESWSDLPQSRP